jgi:signal transduction histidine kinase
MKRYYNIIKLFINLIIFGFALSFEGASPERTALLVLLFASFVAWGFLRPRIKTGGGFWYAVDAALVFFLEYQSKYLVNYFFHILYISAMVEAGISLDRKKGNIAAAILSVAALSKYIYAMGFGVSASILSQLIFNLFALAFLITLINFGKLQQQERDKSQSLYRELVEAYHRLEELSVQKERAAALEERNRIARDMHDSLGHRLTSLIMQIEMGKEYLKKEPDKTDEYLDRCANNAREALTDTRSALRVLGGMGSGGTSGVTSKSSGMASSNTRSSNGKLSSMEGGSGKSNYGIGSITSGKGGNTYGNSSGIVGINSRERVENSEIIGTSIATDCEWNGGMGSDGEGNGIGINIDKKDSIPDRAESIVGMIEDFKANTGTEINYKLPGMRFGARPDTNIGPETGLGPQENGLETETGLGPKETAVLYRVIQEAITNAVRHGKATRIDIEAGLSGDEIWFCIQNNGEAAGHYTEGFGLSSMRKRLESMGGSLEIETEKGFKLTGRFKATAQKV